MAKESKKEKKPKKKLRQLYGADEVQETQRKALPHERDAAAVLPTTADRDATASGDTSQQQFEPGPNFTRSTAAPVLDCTGLDADTHEIWLLQLPLDWRFDAEVTLDVRAQREQSHVLAECMDSSGDRYTALEEAAGMASALYVASAEQQGGMLPRVKRRVTFTRMDPVLREPLVSKSAGKKRKGGAEAAPKQAAELTLEDIVGGPSPVKADGEERRDVSEGTKKEEERNSKGREQNSERKEKKRKRDKKQKTKDQGQRNHVCLEEVALLAALGIAEGGHT